MKTAYDILKERGFIEQLTHEQEIIDLFKKEKVTFYLGIDATADSLTAGHFLMTMAMAHLQRAGHRPIVLIGGGTTMIGDPSGRSDLRQIMTIEQINQNASIFKEQLSHFLDFSDGQAIMVNNADWLLNLNYINFLRDYGSHFSVNRMLTADCYKSRLEQGLTFLEFNYMIMQAYDFLELNRRHDCLLQCGGNDQWSNIIAGVELIRRVERKPAYGMTFKLLTTSDGVKMGKSSKGAIWIDPKKTSPYDFFQYWRNIEDAKVEEALALLTFLPMEEVRRLGALEGAQINQAKEVLAFELTKIIHGQAEADKALKASKTLFGGGKLQGSVPTLTITSEQLNEGGYALMDALVDTGLAFSRSDARRNISQGGVRVNEHQITDFGYQLTDKDFTDNECMLQRGKKKYHRLSLTH